MVSGTSGGLPAVSIEFKEYGIRLNFIPTITPRGTIRLQVAPEVSALDYTNEVQISGFTVPGLTTRRVNTEVELADGESFLIGGLLDKSLTDTFEKIPFIGDIPILGKLFQSDSTDEERYRADCARDAGDRGADSSGQATSGTALSATISAAQFEYSDASTG